LPFGSRARPSAVPRCTPSIAQRKQLAAVQFDWIIERPPQPQGIPLLHPCDEPLGHLRHIVGIAGSVLLGNQSRRPLFRRGGQGPKSRQTRDSRIPSLTLRVCIKAMRTASVRSGSLGLPRTWFARL
jgi:hypothetical protein